MIENTDRFQALSTEELELILTRVFLTIYGPIGVDKYDIKKWVPVDPGTRMYNEYRSKERVWRIPNSYIFQVLREMKSTKDAVIKTFTTIEQDWELLTSNARLKLIEIFPDLSSNV